jgi:hypothetical protein
VFGSSQAEVLRFVARNPRPFRVAADPTASSLTRYGIERSLWRKIGAVVMRVPTLLRGLHIVAWWASTPTT